MTMQKTILRETDKEVLIKVINTDSAADTLSVALNSANDLTRNKTAGAPLFTLDISEIDWSINGGSVKLAWDATADIDAVVLSGNGTNPLNVPNNAGAGVTGNLLLSTIGFAAGSTYTIFIRLIKKIGFNGN